MRTKKWILSVLLLVAVTVPLSAQWRYVKTSAEITVAGTAVSLFVSTEVAAGLGHPQAVVAVCSLLGANIRISYDGVAPTTSLGDVLVPGNYVITGTDVMLSMQGIRDDSTSATWNCVLQGN